MVQLNWQNGSSTELLISCTFVPKAEPFDKIENKKKGRCYQSLHYISLQDAFVGIRYCRAT